MFLRLAFFLLSTLLAFSCSQKASESAINVKLQFGLFSELSVLVSAKNTDTGKRVSKSFEAGGDDVSLLLPNGKWKFAFIAWDGPNPLEGITFCDEVEAELIGGELDLDIALDTANCATETFNASDAYDATEGLKYLKFHGCSTFTNVVDETSSCEFFDRSFHRSFKIAMLDFNEVTGSAPQVGFDSGCLPVPGVTGELLTSLKIPLITTKSMFGYQFESYETSDCSGTPETLTLTEGFASSNSQLKVGASPHAVVFLKTKSVVSTTSVLVEPNTSVEMGAKVATYALGASDSGPYVFRSLDNGAGEYLLKTSTSLAENSATDVFSTALNPVGLEVPKHVVRVGNKLFISVLADNGANYKLYSYDGSAAAELSSPITNPAASLPYAGVMTKLFVQGTDIYYGFQEDFTAEVKLCVYAVGSATNDCAIANANYDLVDILFTSSTKVIYLAKDLSNSSNLTLVSYNISGNTHTPDAMDISTYNTYVDMDRWFSNGVNYSLLHFAINDLFLSFNPNAITYNFPFPIWPEFGMTDIGPSNVVVVDGKPFVGSLGSYQNIFTLTSTAVGPDPVNSEIIGTIGNYLYFLSDAGNMGSVNLYAFRSTNNSLTKVTNYTNIPMLQAAIMGTKVYVIGPYGSATNTALTSVSGVTQTNILELNASQIPGMIGPPMMIHQSKLYFSVDDGSHGFEPWVTNGTAAGTMLLSDTTGDITDGNPEFMGAVGDYVLFNSAGTIYRTKGNVASTQILLGALGVNLVFGSGETLGTNLVIGMDDFGNNQNHILNIKTP